MPSSSAYLSGLAVLAFLVAPSAAQTVEPRYAAAANWASYDGDNTGRRYRELDEITPANVSKLAVQWVFQFQPSLSRALATPVVIISPTKVPKAAVTSFLRSVIESLLQDPGIESPRLEQEPHSSTRVS